MSVSTAQQLLDILLGVLALLLLLLVLFSICFFYRRLVYFLVDLFSRLKKFMSPPLPPRRPSYSVDPSSRHISTPSVQSHFHPFPLSQNLEDVAWAISLYSIDMLDNSFFDRYPSVLRNHSLSRLQNLCAIALMRSFIFIQHDYVVAHQHSFTATMQRILDIPDFIDLWNEINFYFNSSSSKSRISSYSNHPKSSIQTAFFFVCAEYLFYKLTLNRQISDSSYGIVYIASALKSFFA